MTPISWRRLVLLVTACALVAVGAVVLLGSGSASAPTPATHQPSSPSATRTPTPSASELAAQRRRAELVAVLAAREKAVVDGDAALWRAQLTPTNSALAADEKVLFDNLQRIKMSRYSYTILVDQPGDTPDEESLHVELHERIAGFDERDVVRDGRLELVRRQGHWYIDLDRVSGDLWNLGPVQVVRQPGLLVIGRPGKHQPLSTFAASARAAMTVVERTATWPWPRRVVLEVPGSDTELSRIVGSDGSMMGVDTYAAMAWLEWGSRDEKSSPAPPPTRVAVNPKAFQDYDGVARRFVLAHELTHVATYSLGTSGVNLWLTEGFADAVADAEAPDWWLVRSVDQVTHGRLPRALPTQGDFEHQDTIDVAYAASWSLVRAVEEHWGRAATVQLYKTVAASTTYDDDQAMHEGLASVLHTDEAGLVRVWQGYLRAHRR